MRKSLIFLILISFVLLLVSFSYNEDPKDDTIAPGGYYSEGENSIIRNQNTKTFHFYYISNNERIEYCYVSAGIGQTA